MRKQLISKDLHVYFSNPHKLIWGRWVGKAQRLVYNKTVSRLKNNIKTRSLILVTHTQNETAASRQKSPQFLRESYCP